MPVRENRNNDLVVSDSMIEVWQHCPAGPSAQQARGDTWPQVSIYVLNHPFDGINTRFINKLVSFVMQTIPSIREVHGHKIIYGAGEKSTSIARNYSRSHTTPIVLLISSQSS